MDTCIKLSCILQIYHKFVNDISIKLEKYCGKNKRKKRKSPQINHLGGFGNRDRGSQRPYRLLPWWALNSKEEGGPTMLSTTVFALLPSKVQTCLLSYWQEHYEKHPTHFCVNVVLTPHMTF